MNNNDKIKAKINISDRALLRTYAQKELVERFMKEFLSSQKTIALSAALTLLFQAIEENRLEIVQDFSSKNKKTERNLKKWEKRKSYL